MVTHRTTRLRARAHGFTLVEVLVVIAIIGSLVAMLLPAVQGARSAARRVSCNNNLHQIGLALLDYHNAHRCFPPGGIEPISAKWPKGRQIAWSAMLLPYLGQEPLHKQIDFCKPFDAEENAAAAAVVVETYVCPSVSRTSSLVEERAVCDYGGIYGERITSPNNPPKGTMLYDRVVRIRQILDGPSNTLIVSEDGGFRDGQWINGRNVFDQAFGINQAPEFENDIRSDHSGGANGLLADGSARFLSEKMDLKTLAALCTRQGREPVGDF
ncbi:MAG: DUF1559 domain-containing protein [Candidatus Nealsonbacteria bacterium]|nr:DUF1559 domain-containing protein [Candidatus Nealsonbacteria bacterium]